MKERTGSSGPRACSPLHHPPRQLLQRERPGREGADSSAGRGGASSAAGFIPVGRGAWRSCAAAGGVGHPRRRGQRFPFEGAAGTGAAVGRSSSPGAVRCSASPMFECDRTKPPLCVLYPFWVSVTNVELWLLLLACVES